ncbi:hypothetical protein [Micromonospora sp. WMMD737]|uniref:hypothetical protein n=1 Tax=Micromonospora sp. WMMD737 TaxID=3404113 RepID=UPI003B93460B
MKTNRLAGHTLPNEGRISRDGYPVCCGPAVCSCGARSEGLHGANARKRWHRQHKDNIRAAQNETRP